MYHTVARDHLSQAHIHKSIIQQQVWYSMHDSGMFWLHGQKIWHRHWSRVNSGRVRETSRHV